MFAIVVGLSETAFLGGAAVSASEKTTTDLNCADRFPFSLTGIPNEFGHHAGIVACSIVGISLLTSSQEYFVGFRDTYSHRCRKEVRVWERIRRFRISRRGRCFRF